jgi:Phosphoesterase family
VNLTSPSPLPTSCADSFNGTPFQSAFKNLPFKIDSSIAVTDTTCPAPGVSAPNGVLKGSGLPGGCTKDLVHRFYNEQYQINQGKQNRYVTAGDAAGLSMGFYDTVKLPIYVYLHSKGAPNYVITDHFFQGAFGESFLNHQWLIAASTPIFAGALNDGSANDLHSVVDQNGMPTSTPLYVSPLGSEAKDSSLTASCSPPPGRPATPKNVVCGDFAVNTTQPFYWPYSPGTSDARRLPPLGNPTIGSRPPAPIGRGTRAAGQMPMGTSARRAGPTAMVQTAAIPMPTRRQVFRVAQTSFSNIIISRSTTLKTTRRAQRPVPLTFAMRQNSSRPQKRHAQTRQLYKAGRRGK